MKKDKFLIIFAISASLFFLSFSLGYQLVTQKTDDTKISKSEKNHENKNMDVKDKEIISEEQKVSPNTVIEQRVLYKECGDLIVTNEFPNNVIINMTKEEYDDYLLEEGSGLRVISFNNKKIVVWGEKDLLCTKHFIIGEQDGNIVVFKIDHNGEQVIYKKFEDYPVDLLMELDQEKLKKGIRVDDEEELSDVLENFIS